MQQALKDIPSSCADNLIVIEKAAPRLFASKVFPSPSKLREETSRHPLLCSFLGI
jgi:hypothetical protein